MYKIHTFPQSYISSNNQAVFKRGPTELLARAAGSNKDVAPTSPHPCWNETSVVQLLLNHPSLTHVPVCNTNKLTCLPRWFWVQLFLWSEISALSGMDRCLFLSPPGKVTQREQEKGITTFSTHWRNSNKAMLL